MAKSKARLTLQNVTLPPDEIGRILARFPLTNPIHFYDFEFSAQFQSAIFPIELGIASYCLPKGTEVNHFHALISPGKPKPIFRHAEGIHGIPATAPELTRNFPALCAAITKYLNAFPAPRLLVSKEEKLSSDVRCFLHLFTQGTAALPPHVVFLTHHDLYAALARLANVPPLTPFALNTAYRQIPPAPPCPFHRRISWFFHCALDDARVTALLFVALRVFHGLPVRPPPALPPLVVVEQDWSLDPSVLLFTAQECVSDENELCTVAVGVGTGKAPPPGRFVQHGTFADRATFDAAVAGLEKFARGCNARPIVVTVSKQPDTALPVVTTPRVRTVSIVELLAVICKTHRKLPRFQRTVKGIAALFPEQQPPAVPCKAHRAVPDACPSVAAASAAFWVRLLLANAEELSARAEREAAAAPPKPPKPTAGKAARAAKPKPAAAPEAPPCPADADVAYALSHLD